MLSKVFQSGNVLMPNNIPLTNKYIQTKYKQKTMREVNMAVDWE